MDSMSENSRGTCTGEEIALKWNVTYLCRLHEVARALSGLLAGGMTFQNLWGDSFLQYPMSMDTNAFTVGPL